MLDRTRATLAAVQSRGLRVLPSPIRVSRRSYALPMLARSPLQGLRVLDLSRVLAGPFCTQLLGDLGAEVIKVEHPVRGDDTRAWGPPFVGQTSCDQNASRESAYFYSANRNKKSIGLSFQHKEGVRILHELARSADILVENYLPGTLKKYKLDYDHVKSINPGLIYASITGYGQTGPFSSRGGYDVMVEAEFGLMHITGERDGPPVKVGVAVTDLSTGLFATNSILAAILARATNGGRGQWLDIALSDCQTAILSSIASSVLVSDQRDSGRWGTAHPSIVPYRGFKTMDGAIMIGGGNDKLFGILCDRINQPDWQNDERFRTNSDRVRNRTVLEPLIEDIIVGRTTQAWLNALDGCGLPHAPINDVKDALNLEHTRARSMVVEVEHSKYGRTKILNHPVKYSRSDVSVRTAPPTLGQHTDDILINLVGLSSSEVEKLRREGVVS